MSPSIRTILTDSAPDVDRVDSPLVSSLLEGVGENILANVAVHDVKPSDEYRTSGHPSRARFAYSLAASFLLIVGVGSYMVFSNGQLTETTFETSGSAESGSPDASDGAESGSAESNNAESNNAGTPDSAESTNAGTSDESVTKSTVVDEPLGESPIVDSTAPESVAAEDPPVASLYLDVVDATGKSLAQILDDDPVADLTNLSDTAFTFVLSGEIEEVASVRLRLEGPDSYSRIENTIPLALFGNTADMFEVRKLESGSYSISVQVYPRSNAKGALIENRTFTFTV